MVIIKDFPMPWSCGQCDFLDNYGYCLAQHGELRVDRRCTGKRDKNCPLIDIKGLRLEQIREVVEDGTN